MRREYLLDGDSDSSFRTYVSRTRSLVESELAKLLSSRCELSLHPQIEYAVLSKGKRLRPLLVILSAESVGGSIGDVMSLALAFELMHTATLVHDDVIDQDDVRRDNPALHRKYSVNEAVLTGDALIALAIDLASGYGETTLKTVAQSALELCDGEHMDITFSLETTEKSYLRKIRKKSASLFRAATRCGALVGGGTPLEVHSLSAFGEDLGIAYQLRDDLLDFTFEGNAVSKDIKNGTITLPLIHLYATSDSKERRQIENRLQTIAEGNWESRIEASKRILRMVHRSGSLGYCERKIDEHLNRATASLSSLRYSEHRNFLIEMAGVLNESGRIQKSFWRRI